MLGFEIEEPFFAVQARAVAYEAGATHDAMARDDEDDGVSVEGVSYGAGCAGVADGLSDCAVCLGASVRNVEGCAPDALLERAACDV